MNTDKRTNGKVLLSHPTGNTFSRAATEALHSLDIIDRFHTCVAVGNNCRNPLKRRLYRQRYCAIPDHLIETHPVRELLRLLTHKKGWLDSLRRHETGLLSVDKVYHGLDHNVASTLLRSRALPAAVYAYEDGALESFEAAKRLGLHSIYDLPIGYWRAARIIQAEEAELLPEWADTMPALRDSQEKLDRKDEELSLADDIIVASQFTAKTLEEVPFPLPKPIIVPYGCPPAADDISSSEPDESPLRVLYVGGLTQRKGISYLLEAVEQVGAEVELTIVGRRVAECKPLDAALNKHKWIESLPHAGILDIMRRNDVLVFPSLFEGFGLVLTEALSQGLPIIASHNTCAPDIIEDGKEGFIIPIRSADAIAANLSRLYHDRELLRSMKESALKRAKEIGWDKYKSGIASVVGNILKK